MTRSPKTISAMALAAAMFIVALAAGGGCSSSSTPSVTASPTPIPSVSVGPTVTPTTTPTPNNFVIMAYSGVLPTTDPTYGQVQGYGQASAAPATPLPTVVSKVITVQCNQTIQFFNVDRAQVHTVSLLGPTTNSTWFPWNNANSPNVTSPQYTGVPATLTPITYLQFNATVGVAGTTPTSSLVYSTGTTAGAFQFGDYTSYALSPPMRTVIVITQPGCM